MTDPALRTLNDSGFPLQIAVHHQIEQSKARHGWSVRYSEHAWDSRDEGRSGFIDLVLQNQYRTGYIVIECKRPRDSDWVFLHSDGKANTRAHAQVWVSHYLGGTMQWFDWSHVTVDPICPEVQFCAVRGQSTAERVTLLEKAAAELVLATERLAHEHRDYRHPENPSLQLFSCVLVTTAKLKVARFDPESISLVDGTLATATFEDVPFVRFRKQLGVHSSRLSSHQWSSGADVSYMKESTVFVVNAEYICQFLENFEIRDSSLQQFLGAAYHSLNRTFCGKPLQAIISFLALRSLPQNAA